MDGAEESDLADAVFERIKELFDELGLVAATEKDVAPTFEMLCLNLSVPEFRNVELTEELDKWLLMSQMSKRDVHKLLGKLFYVAACVVPGRAFMTGLISALSSFNTRACKIEHYTRRLRRTCDGGNCSLRVIMGYPFFPGVIVLDDVTLFSTDACLAGERGGCGAICMDEFFHAEFP